MSDDSKRKTLAERFEGWSRRSLVFVGITVSALLISSVVVIVGGVKDVIRWAEPAKDWRPAEYARLEVLRAGYTLAEFERVLGTPLFSRAAAPRLAEDIFRGRDYWVQAITDRSGTVILYAVTSCSPSFTPTFHMSIPSRNGKGLASVTLNRTRFTQVLPPGEEARVRADDNTGASADQWYFDRYYGANPGFYKSYAWGLNDACPNWLPFISKLEKEGLTPGGDRLNYQGYVLDGGPGVARFRAAVPVNTFGETSVFPTARGFGFPRLRIGLHIGADRILIRTATLH